jgi:hypothetical protein
MTAIPNDLMAKDREAELVCDACGEAFLVLVRDGEDVTQDQAECPITDCDGTGEEV